MISKNELKYYSSLLHKKFRHDENKFIVEGTKIVIEAFNSTCKPEIALITNDYKEEHPDIYEYLSSRTRTEVLRNIEFIKLSDTVTPQGIAAVFYTKNLTFKAPELKSKTVVLLDNISDPGNVGTILRTCDWFGIKDIILSTGCAEVYNPKTLRGSMGSVFHLNTYENISPEEALTALKHSAYKIYTTDTKGDSIFETATPDKLVLVFSNEANGPSEAVLHHTDKKITIPGEGKAESLNVSAAAGIIIGELYRKQKLR